MKWFCFLIGCKATSPPSRILKLICWTRDIILSMVGNSNNEALSHRPAPAGMCQLQYYLTYRKPYAYYYVNVTSSYILYNQSGLPRMDPTNGRILFLTIMYSVSRKSRETSISFECFEISITILYPRQIFLKILMILWVMKLFCPIKKILYGENFNVFNGTPYLETYH